jgi:CRP-like cAMP-binding protein
MTGVRHIPGSVQTNVAKAAIGTMCKALSPQQALFGAPCYPCRGLCFSEGARRVAMVKTTPIGENRLLARLSAADLSALQPDLKKLDMAQGTVLHPPATPIEHVYFPLSGMVSLLAVMKTGEQIETGIIGREGVVGASIANHGLYSFGQATVQIAGSALRIKSDAFLKMFNRSAPFRLAMNSFQSVILLQAQQSGACHALHPVEARLCRWLLQSQDVIESDAVPLTQEFLSHMLGVQRNAVSISATALHERKVISYTRGNIKILDRAALKKCACECYDVIREHVHRVTNGSRDK